MKNEIVGKQTIFIYHRLSISLLLGKKEKKKRRLHRLSISLLLGKKKKEKRKKEKKKRRRLHRLSISLLLGKKRKGFHPDLHVLHCPITTSAFLYFDLFQTLMV